MRHKINYYYFEKNMFKDQLCFLFLPPDALEICLIVYLKQNVSSFHLFQ